MGEGKKELKFQLHDWSVLGQWEAFIDHCNIQLKRTNTYKKKNRMREGGEMKGLFIFPVKKLLFLFFFLCKETYSDKKKLHTLSFFPFPVCVRNKVFFTCFYFSICFFLLPTQSLSSCVPFKGQLRLELSKQ